MLSRITPCLLLFAALLGQKQASLPEGAPKAMAQIVGKEMLLHATFLASDELGGRLTGSSGQLRAANYIAEQFALLGLEPLGDEVDGKIGYLQRYGITRTFVREAFLLQIGEQKFVDGFAVLGGKPRKVAVAGEVRFVGRGRTRGESAEVKEDETLDDVIPVAVLRTPRGPVGKKLSVEQKFGMSFQALSSLGKTAQALGKKGAKLVIFALVDDPTGFTDVLNYVGLYPGKDLIAPRLPGVMDSTGMLAGLLGGTGDTMVLVLTPEKSALVFDALGVDRTAVGKYLTGEGEPVVSGKEAKGEIKLEVAFDANATACNVVACLRGSDAQLASEAVVYSAHHDHIGSRMDGDVFNGADDNASGSSGLLAIAKAFAKSEARSLRSLVFLSVSGEELGLWGSAYFADNPTWPLPQIIADINTDMIGRSGPESKPDEVTVTPSHDHKMFSTIVQDAARFAERMQLGLQSGDKYYERSDHFNFAKKQIPVVFFCTGEHEDYHQVSDTADKLEPEKMERLARLAFWTGFEVANAKERPRTLGPSSDWK